VSKIDEKVRPMAATEQREVKGNVCNESRGCKDTAPEEFTRLLLRRTHTCPLRIFLSHDEFGPYLREYAQCGKESKGYAFHLMRIVSE